MRSRILKRSEPCPHERVLEPPSRRSPGEILAQEMLAFERLERPLHRGTLRSLKTPPSAAHSRAAFMRRVTLRE
jgi:hypothetical protein